MCLLDVCATHPELESVQYGFDFDTDGIRILDVDVLSIDLSRYDLVVLPPTDSIRDLRVSAYLIRFAAQFGIPTVYWSEVWMPESGRWSAKRRIKRLLKKAAVGCVARNATSCIAAGEMARTFLIDLGIDDVHMVVDSSEVGIVDSLKLKEIAFSIPKERKVILYFGRLEKVKGMDYLARAYSRLRKNREDVFLLICGDGECRESVEGILRSSCPEGSYRLVGKVAPRYRASYYAVATVSVLPSCENDGQIEIWGLSINESLDAGVPVISTDAAGASYDIVDETVGAVVPQRNEKKLAEAIDCILDKNAHGEMRGSCIERARRYSVSSMAEGFYEVFLAVSKKGNFS